MPNCWCGKSMYKINTTRGILNERAERWQCPDEGAHERKRSGVQRPSDSDTPNPPKKKRSWW